MGNAQEYDQIAQEVFFPIYEVIAADILSCTKKTAGRLLDLGCGGGHLGLKVLQAAEHMTGILMDCNPEAAFIAEKRAGDWGLGNRAMVVIGDVHQIPLPDGCIDLAVSRGSIGFWKDVKQAFSEIIRVLKPGGCMFIGSGMGSNKEVCAEVTRKMKAKNPDWPDCVHRISNGLTGEDFLAILNKLGARCEVIDDRDRGKWTILCRKETPEVQTAE
ncbi:MAG: methyltransferase domain-containing protein [Oscillospiraceae bacterium]|jgi:ubiquinone/menaquinone biosynthesis C-methylase UbiE|nr:methyltransferase domain-containing protein [Oscillospiraceae bacterium]